jgi:hypothetical protein
MLTGNASQLAVPLAAVRTDKPLPYVQVLQAGKPAVAAHRSVPRKWLTAQSFA